MAESDGLPSWNLEARDGYVEAHQTMFNAYEDTAVRRVLKLLRLDPLARQITRSVGEVTGTSFCTFAAFHELTQFPIRFATGRVRNVKFLSIADLFDRFTTTKVFQEFQRVVAESEAEAGDAIGLIFSFTGDAEVPGPKGGRHMVLHTFASTPPLNTTRITRTIRQGNQEFTCTLETLDSLMRSFAGWGEELRG